MKRHFFGYVLNTEGQAVSSARVHVFLANQTSGSAIAASSIANNIFSDIADSAYAYIGITRTQTEITYAKSNTAGGEILTDSNGYFEFWVSDKETSASSKGYEYTQKFTIAWTKSGITPGYVEYIDIFSIHHEVDETDKTSTLSTNRNKLLSNKIATLLEEHRTTTYSGSPHNIQQVDETDTNTTKNKMISNSLAKKFDDHVDDNALGGGSVHDQYLRRDATKGMSATTLISNLNADLLDSQQGSYYTGYTDTHEAKITGIHGITGNVVGTSDSQILTNKTITNMTVELAVVDGGTGSSTPSGARTNLGLGDAAVEDKTKFVQRTITTPVSGGGSQTIKSNIEFLDDNDNITLEIDAEFGSVGFFGTAAPTAQGSSSNLLSLPPSANLSGSDTVDLDQFYEHVQDLHTQLQNVITILKDHGLSS